MSLIPILKYLLPKISTGALVYYMKSPEHNDDESQNDMMFEELRARGFFLKESNLELIKE